jgi:glycosyltransferase involved in cell wall biosynthesis
VIASYRWPEALRLSLESALAQTLASIEVLVIEDGTDAASGKVVLEVADPRARSASLSSTSGSQSGPNADGWRLARAPIIAYLGHDDLWHPEHLERLVETLTPEFDVAHAISFYLGDDADDRLEVAGSHPWDETMFVPPSSIAHWRDSPRLGTWRGAGESGEPVDYAFLVACARRGARFAGSGAPTVFKHPAAWRLDAYRTRDVSHS